MLTELRSILNCDVHKIDHRMVSNREEPLQEGGTGTPLRPAT